MNEFVNNDLSQQSMITQLQRIADVLEQRRTNAPLDENTKRKAAYALNLCLVSVSQIIDYADEYILEQEYNGILNNLNLEHMPKDDALLDILRQLLDTITFFRIQEEEKRFIEQEYQNKMKAAIWQGLPNCQAIFSSGHWVAMLVTLLGQVGTGYMNYRNAKAEASKDKSKEMWELQKAALEQFNGLRRELFTTAWKLADKYQFADSWRLTESLISRYNRVLMDPNLSRRLSRLESLENSFQAFPPFWYFKGHTALMISQKGTANCTEMSRIAKTAYEKYFEINSKDSELLRTDPIMASCALEYITLLEPADIQAKHMYIQRAIEHAGDHNDILQLCATAYLDTGATKEAAQILRYLVCEGYNEDLNAQMLSMLYVQGYLAEESHPTHYLTDYQTLCKFTDENALLPWPARTEATIQTQYAEFLKNHRSALLENYAQFMVHFYTHKAKECCALVKAYPSNREQVLIRFTRALCEDLSDFPHAAISTGELIRCISPHQQQFEAVITSGLCTSKIFEEIFGEVFLTSARSISGIQLASMENITELEIALSQAAGKLSMQAIRSTEDDPPEDTLRNLLELADESSEVFRQIRQRVKSTRLILPDAKHTKLLLSGEQEYYRYLKDNGNLDETHVVAVINDYSLRDCDLLITVNGLCVRNMQSKGAKSVKWAVLGPLKLIENGICALLPGEIPYIDVAYKSDKLQTPNYKNKEVNMDELCRLIDDIKQTCLDDSLEHQLYHIITAPTQNSDHIE